MQTSVSIDDRANDLPPEDIVVVDYRKALGMASELRAVGATDSAQIWERLATFLEQSEDYIFDRDSDRASPTNS